MPFHKKSIVYSRSSIVKEFGFTLIELLVVISLLAILAGIILVSTNNARDKGKDAQRKQDLKSLSAALVAYRADNNHWPPTDTASTTSDYASDAGDNWLPDLEGTYIKKLPRDPANSTVNPPTEPEDDDDACKKKSFIYCYHLFSNKKTFVLWTQLENLNDPQIYTNSGAACREPRPEKSTLNYCLKSPPN